MKRRVLALVLGAAAALLLASAALAKLPEPPDAGGGHASQAPPYRGWLEGSELLRQQSGSGLQMNPEASAEPQQVTVGEPGLSFRYVDTFGVTEQAYPADVQHLNRPMGLFVDGADNLYVVEQFGQRMLKYRTSDGQNLMTIGTAGASYMDEYIFADPNSVFVDGGGHIWIIDEHRVIEYDSGGTFLHTFPDWDDEPWRCAEDNGHFCEPTGIAFDAAGRMYVSDQGNNRVQVFSFSGGTPVYSTTIGVTSTPGDDNSHFNGPGQIVIDGSNRLYVADQSNHRIQQCTYSTGWTCETFHGTGSQGSGDDELSYPLGLGIDTSDNIYIADALNDRVKTCDTDGNCTTVVSGGLWPTDVAVDSSGNLYVSYSTDCTIRKYNSTGGALGIFKGVSGVPYVPDTARLNGPWGIAVAPDGSVYVTENRGYRLVKLNASGAQQWAAGEAGVFGDDSAHLGNWWAGPEGNLAVDAAGRIYVPDTGNQRIQIFNPDGTYHTYFGSYGTGNYQFDCPAGVAISPVNGYIFVVDRCNQRVQVYDSNRVWKARLGQTGQTGSDNSHFNWPWGVAVDTSGNVYVADTDNYRVQKCVLVGTGGTCSTFAGVTGEWGNDHAHLQPHAVAVDGLGRVYVADKWENRVQVFDSSGAYLTTIGGDWGSNTGQMRGVAGVALDAHGNVYVTDQQNHRVQKFAPGVPGWRQVNINGFGDRWNELLLSLASFGGTLYAGTYNWDLGAQVWRMGSAWEQVNTNGFGDGDNLGVDHLMEFNGQLYAGTWANEVDGGEVWRSTNGTSWDRVVSNGFGDPTNAEVMRFAVFGDHLYASTWSYTDTHGAEIWRSDSGDSGSWTQVASDGFDGDSSNEGAVSLEVFNDYLYAGTANSDTGGEVWRTQNGTDWSQVNDDGFGDADNWAVSALAAFNDHLYASTRHEWGEGAEVWSCQECDGSDWTQVVDDGFGNSDANYTSALEVFRDLLYFVVGNGSTGLEVWRTADGANWQQVGFAGFGDSNNIGPYWDNAAAVVNDQLYVSSVNYAQGGEIWTQQLIVYVPLVMKNF